MNSALIFSFSDVGRNERILRYTKKLIVDKKFKVYLVGFDISDLPSELEKLPNLVIRYIFPFFSLPIILNTIFWPFQFLFYLIQIIGIAVNTPSVKLIISSTDYYFTETLCGLILSKIKEAALIFDVSNFDWFESFFSCVISKKMLSYADYIICSTHSMEVILKLGGIKSYVIPNIPDRSFSQSTSKSNQTLEFTAHQIEFPEIQQTQENNNNHTKNVNQVLLNNTFNSYYEIKSKVCEMMNIDIHSKLIGVPIPQFSHELMNNLIDSANYLKSYLIKNKISINFVLFGSGKSSQMFREKLKDLEIENAKFHFVPFQYDAYPMILRACDVCLCLSNSHSIMEVDPHVMNAAACGVPIIALKYGCSNEILEENVNGIYIQDIKDLSPIMKKIFIDNSIDLSKMRMNNESFSKKADLMFEETFSRILGMYSS
ncbi:hypothetical protein TRFO_07350 [Tritrichomonas foetus]|uniref:Beta-1,4-mannosyltransferase n=1 Tax=Tritrichomonas foetus TaxID=1144522 RepID=A0A1J4JRN8_9EUKA|nr:hypothetical protein TRFO_07350 [Tritrichomonas foetus]|eukprot:OHT01799.1 hypothetical protein TRFO_07350 [Tritrichomonas foetus]